MYVFICRNIFTLYWIGLYILIYVCYFNTHLRINKNKHFVIRINTLLMEIEMLNIKEKN